jgi:uncharacterized protein YbbC (DUF1343 family)
VTDRAAFRPVETGVAVLEATRAADPGAFAWRDPPYEYEYVKPPIDMLYGSAALREALDSGASAGALVKGWADDVRPFMETRARFLQY